MAGMKLPDIDKFQVKISATGLGAMLLSVVAFVFVLYALTIVIRLLFSFWGA